MVNIQMDKSLGEIVAEIPKASEIFKEYRIDFCCGGNRPLGQAIKEQNLDEKEVLARLNTAYEETRALKDQRDFRSMTASVLVDYILNTHHAFAKNILPEISDSVTKVLRAHGANHGELFNVHKLFHDLKADLEQHFIKEEEILFPLIKDYDKEPSEELLNRIISVMGDTESEHDQAGNILKELRRLTRDYHLPEDACMTYERTYNRIKELESDLFQHIHLENNILFKNLREKLNNRVQ